MSGNQPSGSDLPPILHNGIIKGRYSLLLQGFLNDATDKKPYYTPVAALGTVTYDGEVNADGSGGVSGSVVLKFVSNDATVDGWVEKKVAIVEGSKYWIDADEIFGRAFFLVQFPDGSQHQLHFFFVIEDAGKTIKTLSTITAPFNSVQWGNQTRLDPVDRFLD
ncbi:MAG: hypothetical protein KGL59_00060 [Acidobacteriota bacterium]|nr:hypothetical protein [Acidobacteriota bacterium]